MKTNLEFSNQIALPEKSSFCGYFIQWQIMEELHNSIGKHLFKFQSGSDKVYFQGNVFLRNRENKKIKKGAQTLPKQCNRETIEDCSSTILLHVLMYLISCSVVEPKLLRN
jgi:hypothetical protein